jgi:hypothetical protein
LIDITTRAVQNALNMIARRYPEQNTQVVALSVTTFPFTVMFKLDLDVYKLDYIFATYKKEGLTLEAELRYNFQ